MRRIVYIVSALLCGPSSGGANFGRPPRWVGDRPRCNAGAFLPASVDGSATRASIPGSAQACTARAGHGAGPAPGATPVRPPARKPDTAALRTYWASPRPPEPPPPAPRPGLMRHGSPEEVRLYHADSHTTFANFFLLARWRCTVRRARRGLSQVNSHFTATLNVGSIHAARETAARAFWYCPASRYQLVHPLWIERNSPRTTCRMCFGRRWLKRKSPSSRI